MFQRFYKYYSSDVLKEDVLKKILHGEVWLKHPSEFNDPLDSMFNFSTPVDHNALLSFSKTLCSKRGFDEDLWKHVITVSSGNLRKEQGSHPHFSDMYYYLRHEFAENFDDLISDLKSNNDIRTYISTFHAFYEGLGMFCMSKKNDSIPMWSYYSSNHSGICIEYELDFDLMKQRNLKYTDVEYGLEAFVSNTSGATDEEELRRFIRAKSDGWKHEQEVRLYGFAKPKECLFPGRLTSVCMGYKINNKHREMVADLTFEVGLDARHAMIDFRSKEIHWI